MWEGRNRVWSRNCKPSPRRKKGPHAHQILARPAGLSPRRKDKEADPPRSPRSKHPLRILKQVDDATRQETKGGERDKGVKKKRNI